MTRRRNPGKISLDKIKVWVPGIGSTPRVLVCLAGLKLRRNEEGYICTEDPKGDHERQAFGSHKATALLYMTARAMALAEWADLEALVEFYEGLLEEYWTTPGDGFMGPTVEDLRKCEREAWRQAIRTMTSTKCPLEAALQHTAHLSAVSIE